MKFSAITHNLKYKYYCEVIISPKGNIYYATPSHQQCLLQIACKKYKKSEQEIADMCPPEFHADYLQWLCDITGYICVWYHYITGTPNDKQLERINYLIRNNCIDLEGTSI